MSTDKHTLRYSASEISGMIRGDLKGPTHDAFLVSEQNGRDKNEDSGLLVEVGPPGDRSSRFCLLLVADGMGGHAWGERLSREAIRVLSRQILAGVVERFVQPEPQHPDDSGESPIAQVVMDAVKITAHQLARVVEANNVRPAGTTLVAALVEGCQVAYGHLGDSRLYRFVSETRELIQLTEDHSVVAAMVRSGIITDEVAKYHASKNQLEFYAGSGRMPEMEPRLVTCQPGDVILACTDGVSGSFTNEELARCFLGEEGRMLPLTEVASALLEQARAAEVDDNQTVGLVRITDSSCTEAEAEDHEAL